MSIFEVTVDKMWLAGHCLIRESSSTWFNGSQADIVKLMYVSQHKLAAAPNITFWADSCVMRQTADHVNFCFKVVCCSMENDVITPCAISCHATKVNRPRLMSIYKVKQFCPILLQEENIRINIIDRSQPFSFC